MSWPKINWRQLMHRRWTIAVGILLLLVILPVVIQIFYPTNRTLPNTTVAGQRAGRRDQAGLATIVIGQLNQSSIKLIDGDFYQTVKIADLLPPISPTQAVDLPDYQTWQRLIPFSLWWRQDKINSFSISKDHEQIKQILTQISQELNQQPVSARLTIRDGVVELLPSQTGRELDVDGTLTKLSQQALVLGGESAVNLIFRELSPKESSDDLSSLKALAERLISRSVSFVLPNNTLVASSVSDRASWLKLAVDEDGFSTLAINSTELANFAKNRLSKPIYRAPEPILVTLYDGKEVARQPGSAGVELDLSALEQSLTDSWLKQGGPNVNIKLQTTDLVSPVSYTSNYSHSQIGLQSYYNTLANQDIKVVFKQYGGGGWQASVGGGDSVVAASTYKLFVALRLFDEINSGRIGWQVSVTSGQTAEQCLKSMMVLSNNDCVEAWLAEWGRSNLNNYLYSRGISRATTFTDQVAARTSASDLALVLDKLYSREWFNTEDGTRLSNYMGEQIYRRGIPVGSSGTTLDKVGFLNEYLHDAALVYHPKGNYLLVILTKNASWAKIAEITRQTEAIIYP